MWFTKLKGPIIIFGSAACRCSAVKPADLKHPTPDVQRKDKKKCADLIRGDEFGGGKCNVVEVVSVFVQLGIELTRCWLVGEHRSYNRALG